MKLAPGVVSSAMPRVNPDAASRKAQKERLGYWAEVVSARAVERSVSFILKLAPVCNEGQWRTGSESLKFGPTRQASFLDQGEKKVKSQFQSRIQETFSWRFTGGNLYVFHPILSSPPTL
jgi:hypothetical protein